MGCLVILRWFPSCSHSRLSSLVSAGSCVVRVCRGGSCCLRCSGVVSSAFPLLSWSCLLRLGRVRVLIVWTQGLGALSRRLVDSCGVVVLTVLCGLLSPFRVLCCCPCLGSVRMTG